MGRVLDVVNSSLPRPKCCMIIVALDCHDNALLELQIVLQL